jgi:hypothetical protein
MPKKKWWHKKGCEKTMSCADGYIWHWQSCDCIKKTPWRKQSDPSKDLIKARRMQRPPDSLSNWTVTVNNVNSNSCLANGILDFLVEAPPGICYNNPTITFNLIDASGNYIVQDYSCVGGVPGSHVFTGTPSLYTLTFINQMIGGTVRIPYCNLPTGSYTFTIFSTTCNGVAGTNTPIVFNETITHTFSSLCKYWPELTVCYTSSDPVVLNTIIAGSSPATTYGQFFSFFPVGTVHQYCSVNATIQTVGQWHVDGAPLSPADIGKSIDMGAPIYPSPAGGVLVGFIPGVFITTITDVCIPVNLQTLTTPIVPAISTPCPPCDAGAWNAIPYAYKIDWPHDSSIFYNPPIILPPQLIAQGYISPSTGGTGFPQGYHMQNLSANLDYPNQFTICEWCADWVANSSIPNTFDNRVLNWGWTLSQAEALCECCPAIDSGYINYPIPPTGTLMW